MIFFENCCKRTKVRRHKTNFNDTYCHFILSVRKIVLQRMKQHLHEIDIKNKRMSCYKIFNNLAQRLEVEVGSLVSKLVTMIHDNATNKDLDKLWLHLTVTFVNIWIWIMAQKRELIWLNMHELISLVIWHDKRKKQSLQIKINLYGISRDVSIS